MLISIKTDGLQTNKEIFNVLESLSEYIDVDCDAFVGTITNPKVYYIEIGDFATEKYKIDIISNNLLSIVITRLPTTFKLNN